MNAIINGEDYTDEIDRIDAITRRGMKIKNFYGNDSEEVKYDKDFELWCVSLSQFTNKSVKDSSTREYFTLMKHAKDQSKKK